MTRKMMLIAGVAGLALTSPAMAERGGRGGGGGGEQRQQAQQQRAERPQQQQRAERPQMQRAERPQMQRAERPQMQRAERPQMQRMERPQRAERPVFQQRQEMRRAERPQRAERPVFQQRQEMRRAERPQRMERAQRAERPQRVERAQRVERPQRAERQAQRFERAQRVERPQRIERQQARMERREQPRFDRNAAIQRADIRDQRRAFANGDRRSLFSDRALAGADGRAYRYNVRDMRPMKPIKSPRYDRIVSVGDRFDRLAATAAVPTYFAARYADTPQYYYRYDDDLGYVYRINRYDQRVNSLIPLFGGYGIGDPWPVTYRSSYVPIGYQQLYYDTPDYYYRYDGNGIYRIDAQTQLISGLVALLTGNSLGIGQMLPASYGVYNVPLAYRSSYYDTDDSWYRYGDGFIYQVDPYSRRIEQRYPLYADYDNYVVGSPWPVAYPDYNVPYGYRSVYYDTPQYQYRYANDRIYQVDPTSQLITAVVALLSGNSFNVGQPLPAGYGTYNVPFAYRDRYYDTNDDWYRYNNGYVYRVDPRSGLIEDAYPVYA